MRIHPGMCVVEIAAQIAYNSFVGTTGCVPKHSPLLPLEGPPC